MSLRTERQRDRETDSKLPTDLEDVEANKKDTCSVAAGASVSFCRLPRWCLDIRSIFAFLNFESCKRQLGLNSRKCRDLALKAHVRGSSFLLVVKA